MMKINIKTDFSQDYITRAAGEKLRNMILEADSKKEKVEIDFSGLTISSTSFFDEGLAKLADAGWTVEKLKTTLVLKNIDSRDLLILHKMYENRGIE